MAERRPLIVKDGRVEEMPSGDTISTAIAPGSGGLTNNFTATAAPGVGNDTTEGYTVGSRWVDVTNDNSYTCVDNSTGAAVWVQENGAGGGASTINDLSDVDTTTVAPTDGQALVWSAADNEWQPGDVAAGGGSGDWELKETITTTGGTSIIVDVAGDDEIRLIMNGVSTSSSGFPNIKLSTDGGVTPLEAATDYEVASISASSEASGQTSSIIFADISATGNHEGHITFQGLNDPAVLTSFELFCGSGASNAIVRAGYATVAATHNAIVIEASAGTFDAMNIQVLRRSAAVGGGGGGASDFLTLTDTPGTFGTAGQMLAVNSTTDALEWVDAPSGGSGGGAPLTPRYWRIWFPDGIHYGNIDGTVVAEIEMMETVGGSDVLVDSMISVSGESFGGVKANITDNNAATWWSHDQDPALGDLWVKADFGDGTGKWIAEMSLTARDSQAGQTRPDYILQYSEDDITWTDVITITGAAEFSNGEKRNHTNPVEQPGAATSFLDNSDTPATFGTAGQILAVNSGTDALEWIDAPSGGGSVAAYYGTALASNLGTTLSTSTSGYASKGNLLQIQNALRIISLDVDLEASSNGNNCEAFVAVMSGATSAATITSITKKAFVSSGAGTQTVTFDTPVQLVQNDIIIFGVTNTSVAASSDPKVRFYTTNSFSENVFINELSNLGARFTDNNLAIGDSPFDLTANWWAININYEPFQAILPIGGTTGQILSKVDGTDFNVAWVDLPAMVQTEITATAYSTVSADFAGDVIRRMNNAATQTITVEPSMTGGQPVTFIRTGAGAVTFAAGVGVTIHSAGGNLSIADQYGSATLVPDATTANTYYLIGNLTT